MTRQAAGGAGPRAGTAAGLAARTVEVAGAATAKNALETLEAVATLVEHGGHPVTLTTIALKAGRNVSSVYRYVNVLMGKGYLKQVDGGYVLGSAVLNLAGIELSRMEVRQEAQPIVQELMRRSGETVHLVVLDGLDVVYIDKAQDSHSDLIRSRIGCRAPAATTAVGKTLVAFGGEDLRRAATRHLVRRTARSETDPRRWLAQIERVAVRGYAIDLGENDEGVHCVAAPIRNARREVVAAISISGPSARLTQARLEQFAPQVQAAAQAVARRLGLRDGPVLKQDRARPGREESQGSTMPTQV